MLRPVLRPRAEGRPWGRSRGDIIIGSRDCSTHSSFKSKVASPRLFRRSCLVQVVGRGVECVELWKQHLASPSQAGQIVLRVVYLFSVSLGPPNPALRSVFL